MATESTGNVGMFHFLRSPFSREPKAPGAGAMSRETKAGLLVTGSFLCLVGMVVFAKLREGEPAGYGADLASNDAVGDVPPPPAPIPNGDSPSAAPAQPNETALTRQTEVRPPSGPLGIEPAKFRFEGDLNSNAGLTPVERPKPLIPRPDPSTSSVAQVPFVGPPAPPPGYVPKAKPQVPAPASGADRATAANPAPSKTLHFPWSKPDKDKPAAKSTVATPAPVIPPPSFDRMGTSAGTTKIEPPKFPSQRPLSEDEPKLTLVKPEKDGKGRIELPPPPSRLMSGGQGGNSELNSASLSENTRPRSVAAVPAPTVGESTIPRPAFPGGKSPTAEPSLGSTEPPSGGLSSPRASRGSISTPAPTNDANGTGRALILAPQPAREIDLASTRQPLASSGRLTPQPITTSEASDRSVRLGSPLSPSPAAGSTGGRLVPEGRLVTPARNSASIQPQVESYDEEEFVCRTNETFRTISQEFYRTPKYERALLLFNRSHPLATEAVRQEPPSLRPGLKVYIPPARILEQYYAAAITDAAAANAGSAEARRPAGVLTSSTVPSIAADKILRVAEGGEMIRDIARRALGDPERWAEIYQLNRNVDPRYPVPAGTELRLPSDARAEK